MKFAGRGSAASLKNVVATMILTAGIGIPLATQAARCDYCGTGGAGGEWSCVTAYTSAGDGPLVPQGRYCTFFAYANAGDSSSWNPVEDVWDWLWERLERRFFRRSGTFIPNSPATNPTPATCDSDALARWQHATFDVVSYNALNPNNPTAAGSTVRVTYDDGDTELWLIHSPFASSPVVMDPIEGSCQQG